MNRRKGFTLIEMLIAVFIFVILFMIAASFVNLAVGSTKSVRTKLLTNDLRNTIDIINQKMNNANGKATPPPIYGFRTNGGILGIASSDDSCTLIGRKTEASSSLGYLAMSTVSCASIHPAWVTSDLTQRLTSTNINILSFDISNSYEMINKNPSQAPYIKIVITAEDTDPKYQADNQITLQTSYTMDYMTIKRLQAL